MFKRTSVIWLYAEDTEMSSTFSLLFSFSVSPVISVYAVAWAVHKPLFIHFISFHDVKKKPCSLFITDHRLIFALQCISQTRLYNMRQSGNGVKHRTFMCELILLMMCYMAVPFVWGIKSHAGWSERRGRHYCWLEGDHSLTLLHFSEQCLPLNLKYYLTLQISPSAAVTILWVKASIFLFDWNIAPESRWRSVCLV